MIELTEKAAKYAAEKANEVIANALAKAYEDGYRDGYKDREEEIPVDFRDNKTEFVDLGLPSGTLWAEDYERQDGNIIFLPYGKAKSLNIPTREQWEELKEFCQWEYIIDKYYDLCEVKCVGPNGNNLIFIHTGKMNIDTKSDEWEVFFWALDDKEGTEKNAIHMYNLGKTYRPQSQQGYTDIEDFFSGFKLPIRLVRAK